MRMTGNITLSDEYDLSKSYEMDHATNLFLCNPPLDEQVVSWITLDSNCTILPTPPMAHLPWEDLEDLEDLEACSTWLATLETMSLDKADWMMLSHT